MLLFDQAPQLCSGARRFLMKFPSTADRVAKCTALLDAKVPGWQAKIDLKKLDMNESSKCLLAQACGEPDRDGKLVGDFHTAQRMLKLDNQQCAELGLISYGASPECQADWQEMRRAWVEWTKPPVQLH